MDCHQPDEKWLPSSLLLDGVDIGGSRDSLLYLPKQRMRKWDVRTLRSWPGEGAGSEVAPSDGQEHLIVKMRWRSGPRTPKCLVEKGRERK